MSETGAEILSEPLREALIDFGLVLRLDDVERGQTIQRAESEMLAALTTAVKPLYEEINRVLDDLVQRPHPLPGSLEQLEYDLSSLAQAATEAEQELDSR
jgi:vacuolar-type H+-ATPase subunit I/STV1